MRVLTGITAVACIGAAALAQEKNAHTLVAEANQASADGDYATALETYRAAELMLPESPELAYNQGVAVYMLGDHAQARDAFNRSLLTQDAGLEARIKFNLGNVAYALALEETSNPSEAINLLRSAIGHYRDAIEVDPEDEDARVNIELAERLIRHLLEKLRQQREEQRKQQDDQQEQQQDNQDERLQGDQQGGQQEAAAEPQEAQMRRQASDRMTAQEVERLLQAVRDKERQRRDELTRRRRARRTPVAKDW
jgi:tetratricopeptide (TPR) repeat protein